MNHNIKHVNIELTKEDETTIASHFYNYFLKKLSTYNKRGIKELSIPLDQETVLADKRLNLKNIHCLCCLYQNDSIRNKLIHLLQQNIFQVNYKYKPDNNKCEHYLEIVW
jgi:hypothetical protein